MSTSAEAAYAAIKNLENTGQITLPEPQATVTVGSINPSTGAFTWSVPTLVQTTTIAPLPQSGQKTNTILNRTAGVVRTNAVDLILKFTLESLQPVLADPWIKTVVSPAAMQASHLQPIGFHGSSPAVTITGFPTISSSGGEILVDAGLACSAMMESESTTPPVTTFGLTITIPGHPQVNISIMIVRPPVLGMGAFTIPALPLALVYAPPQGQLQKNTATYTVAQTFTRAVTTAITQSTSTKTAQAYSPADLIGKVASSIAAVAAIVGTGGAGAGAAAGGGALGAALTSLFGSSGSDSGDSTANSLKTASSSLDLFADILGSVDSSTASQTNTVTTETDQTITIATTNMSAYSTTPGQGPGVGDIFVYFSNVRVVWVAVNGEVGINVLNVGSLVNASAASLQQDLAALNSGGTAGSGLDAATLKLLLSYDPFCAKVPIVVVGPALVAPPRFTPAAQPEINVKGSTVNYGYTLDVTSEDKQVQTTTQATITDFKPGWVSVLFGSDNTETTTTMTFTTTQTTDTKDDLKITNAAAFISQTPGDNLDVLAFTDRTFGTYLYAVSGASVLQGEAVVANGEEALQAAV
jgi:hypothetical protein